MQALLLGALLAGCSAPPPPGPSFRSLERRYVMEFFRRNPVTATYLGADGYAPELAEAYGRLRDWSEKALGEERLLYGGIASELEALSKGSLTPDEAIDAAVIKAQILFMIRQTGTRRHQHRCLDTYVVEAFRGVDWQIQGMTDLGDGRYGTETEWRWIVERVRAVPDYLRTAIANLRHGLVAPEDAPDPRVLERDGLITTDANAVYFGLTLPAQAARYTQGQPWAAGLLEELSIAGASAAGSLRGMRSFIVQSFFEPDSPGPVLREEFRRDRFALGPEEYAWALANNLRETRPTARLEAAAEEAVAEARRLMIDTARRVASERGWSLPWGSPEDDRASLRSAMSRLGRDHPKDDAQMLDWYRAKALELVDYGRRHGLFVIPAQYRLDVLETPPVLRQSVDGAVYYPAPPLKSTGVGRFYVSPTGNDRAHLSKSNRHSMADLCAHEGFPGHDWHFQFLRSRRDRIGAVRWLTPGSVEDSSSMWSDSMPTEGWALYAEQLVGEPVPGFADGFYTPAERLYQLQGRLLRAARVRLDIGLHAGRTAYDEAVDAYTDQVDFMPGACARAASDPEARASCETARRAIFRYSKWPTQAITYHLGKEAILDLRREVKRIQGERFDRRVFHEQVLATGTIPLPYVRERILEWARSVR